MRKFRLFFAAATLCAAAAVGYNAYSNATMTEEERLIEANLEALSKKIEVGPVCAIVSQDECYRATENNVEIDIRGVRI